MMCPTINEESECLRKQICGAALNKVKVAFAWKIWLLSLFLNGKAFTLNKTNKNYIVEWNFQAVSVV
jgi:hypothetical protein